jgi:hypothetical protein
MVIYNTTKKSKVDALPTDKNYLIVESGKVPRQFIYNVYKTAKKYGQQQMNIPETSVENPIHSALLLYLKHHPQRKEKKEFTPFLVAREGPFNSNNSITRVLNRVFKKKIGSSMLRHIYLSSKYDVADRNATAEGMAHSPSLQHKYLKAETITEAPVEPPPKKIKFLKRKLVGTCQSVVADIVSPPPPPSAQLP